MTSFGHRSPARVSAGLAILIFTAVLALPLVCARAQSIFSTGTPSARIQALGTTFSWIIPDQLTDLTLNPARAWDAESLTINYGLRALDDLTLPFPTEPNSTEPDYYSYSVTNRPSNEIRLLGAGAWGWKWATGIEWRLHHDDGCSQSDVNPIYRSSTGRMKLEMRENCDIYDWNYVRFDITSARRLSEGTVLGLRAGGTYQYVSTKIRRRYAYDYYEYNPGTGEYFPDYGRAQDEMRGTARKVFSGYLESGINWKDSGELVVRGGYAKGTYLVNDYNLYIDTGYDNYTGEMNDYDYSIMEPWDDREGDSWLLSAAVKKRYQGGFVIVAAGSYERGSFDPDWGRSYSQYSWGMYSSLQIEDRYEVITEGSRSFSNASFRIGKTYSIERRIDITPGAQIHYTRLKSEEEGQAYISSKIDDNGSMASLQSDFPVEFEQTASRTILRLPVALEFRPASFFHFYSGFAVKFDWNRDSRKNSLLLDQGGLDDPALPDEIENDENTFESTCEATLGFSLRYREKLFFDMYSASNIIPSGNITSNSYVFDLRYVF